ncbi:hypothetical protein Vafri_3790 [Volvox africanus]|uniref:Uncharacterized protein n=1 Tax=Volvox africanus TaxID=51714 RepID=A0A8J4ASD3_9CHLO|nr:hypothetical protein Vafri_3790 [Volvox africanus]
MLPLLLLSPKLMLLLPLLLSPVSPVAAAAAAPGISRPSGGAEFVSEAEPMAAPWSDSDSSAAPSRGVGAGGEGGGEGGLAGGPPSDTIHRGNQPPWSNVPFVIPPAQERSTYNPPPPPPPPPPLPPPSPPSSVGTSLGITPAIGGGTVPLMYTET